MPEATLLRKPRRRDSIVASATRIKIREENYTFKRDAWQAQAWDYYDNVGEVHYGVNFLGNAMSKLRLFAAEIDPDDPEADPVPSENADAQESVARLGSGSGGHAEVLRSGGVNMSVPGECFLVGLSPQDADDVETFGIFSTDELKGSGKQWTLTTGSGSSKRELTEQDMVVRIWIRHPRYSWMADSSLRGVLSSCQELLMIDRAIRAGARSRITNAKALLIPSELTFGPADPTRSQDETEDPFMRALTEAMITPLADEGDASAVVPIVLRGPAEVIAKAQVLDFGREIDEAFDKRTERALRRLSQGLNVPVEVVLGVGDLNHWNSWFVDESAFKMHVQPLTITFLGGLTDGYHRPYLQEAGVPNPENHVIWYDASELTRRPDAAKDATEAYDRGGINSETLREALGFGEDNAPSLDQLLLQAVLKRGQIDAATSRVILGKFLPQLDIPAEVSEPAETEEPIDEPGPPPMEEPERSVPVQASAAPVKPLGEKLAAADKSLMQRLQVAADAALTRVLERAGAKVRSKIRKDAATKQVVAAVTQARVAATLGPSFIEALGLNEHELVESTFAELGVTFNKWVKATQASALVSIPQLEGEALANAIRAFDDARAAAWEWLSGQLNQIALSRLWDPDPKPPKEGEFTEASVPLGTIRTAMAIAGGEELPVTAAVAFAPSQQGFGFGVAFGLLVRQLLGERQITVDAWEWDWSSGGPRNDFPPHRDLDGETFTNPFDAKLANPNPFPPVDFYSPGDHGGCACGATPVLIDADGNII